VRFIGDYKALCDGGTLEGFLERQPPAVFLHHSAGSGLGILSGLPGSTRNRLVLENQAGNRLPGSSAKEEAYLVFPIEPKTNGKNQPMLLGCSSTCDIFVNDATVSRKHALIELARGDYYIMDQKSTAGTWVNGVSLRGGEKTLLTSGDRVSVGAVNLLFLLPKEFYNFVVKFLGD